MKVKDIKYTLNEAFKKKMEQDENSYFEGHDFVTYGKHITTVDIDSPMFVVDKDTVVIKWSGKPEIHNDGIYGFEVVVKSLTADSVKEEGIKDEPLNFNGFEYVVEKEKNPEAQDVQLYIESVFIETQQKKIHVRFKI